MNESSDVCLNDIAIVGLSFQLPRGLQEPAAFWRFLQQAEDAVGPLPEQRHTPLMGADAPHAGYLNDVARFDASFFEMSGLEATYTDPAQRLFLESTWHALERAGIDPQSLAGHAVGVFAGCHTFDYSELAARRGCEVSAYWNTGLNGAMLANRVSYFFDWHGPSVTLNTACSSGLEALVTAVDALHHNRCSTAVVGGVNLILQNTVQTSATRAGMMAPGMRCRTFDADANGFVRGEGVVCLILKPAQEALREGLPIWGLIRAAASGHGGRANSLTAPNLKRQRDLIHKVWLQQGIEARKAAFIETHGTGTKLGDSIEVAALREAFEKLLGGQAQTPFIGLAALKTQLGHLEAAAGLASVVKICLAMRHGSMPKNLHFEKQNPILDLDRGPFYIVDKPALWPQEQPLAGVSAFGFGGSYAHAVLAPAPPNRTAAPATPAATSLPIILSAHKRSVLLQMIQNLQAFMQSHPQLDMGALAYLLCCHRKPMKYRWGMLMGEGDTMSDLARDDANIHEVPKMRRTPVLDAHACVDWSIMLEKWLAGYRVPWSLKLPGSARDLAMSLPVYPFAGKEYFLN